MSEINQVAFFVFRGSLRLSAEKYDTPLRFGHAGISFDHKVIYGFSPADEINNSYFKRALDKIGGPEEAVNEQKRLWLEDDLRDRRRFRGQVRDDTKFFDAAHALYYQKDSPTNGKYPVWWFYLRDEFSDDAFRDLKTRVENLVDHPGDQGSCYKLPEEPMSARIPMPADCDNCLTWPRTLGLTLLDDTGYIDWLEEEMGSLPTGAVQKWKKLPTNK